MDPSEFDSISEERRDELRSRKYSCFSYFITDYVHSDSRKYSDLEYGIDINARPNYDDCGLQEFLSDRRLWHGLSISSVEWRFILWTQMAVADGAGGYVGDPKKDNYNPLPSHRGSCWSAYVESLYGKFSPDSIDQMRLSVSKIINQCELETERNSPVRGMVVGSVQSGKTANIAALITAAADIGYNFFLILSGTIENLRKQTQNRLINDLSVGGANLVFVPLEHLAGNSVMKLQDLDLGPLNGGGRAYPKRYFSVCLKNKSRLKDFLKWVNAEKNSFAPKKGSLRVLLIDDEADQAGINTNDISKDDNPTAINQAIRDIVFARNAKHEEAAPYGAMNYIGYTATPYGNFLNEANDDSLYPQNFITCLTPANEYIGPEQIFGSSEDQPTLSYLNIIDKNEASMQGQIRRSGPCEFPAGFSESLLWFVCTIAIFRNWKIKGPVSMLVHTSVSIQRHKETAESIKLYFEYLKTIDYLNKARDVFEKQKKKVDIESFKAALPKYNHKLHVKEYPSFDDISNEVNNIIKNDLATISLNDDDSFEYSSTGIHLCVDNCGAKFDFESGFNSRIVYPDDKDPINDASPAFIVVGGATLSRGLTLQGLTTSYFLRSTRTADTLMQMCRWFGYRIGYELLPRIWLEEETLRSMKKLAVLDHDLRQEISDMEVRGLSPRDYGPMLDTFPDYKRLIPTARQKSQSATSITISYARFTGQTTSFYNDEQTIKENFDKAFSFVNSLGPIDFQKVRSLENPIATSDSKRRVWFDQDFNKVLDFIDSLKYPIQKASDFKIENMKDWFNKEVTAGRLNNFNIILDGVERYHGPDSILHFDNFDLNLPQRGKGRNSTDEIIKIGAITAPTDHLLDLDFRGKNKEIVNESRFKKASYGAQRLALGMFNTPVLVLYFIDKSSNVKGSSKAGGSNLLPLDLKEHLFGYYLFVPPGNDGIPRLNDINKISVKLNFDRNLGGDDEIL